MNIICGSEAILKISNGLILNYFILLVHWIPLNSLLLNLIRFCYLNSLMKIFDLWNNFCRFCVFFFWRVVFKTERENFRFGYVQSPSSFKISTTLPCVTITGWSLELGKGRYTLEIILWQARWRAHKGKQSLRIESRASQISKTRCDIVVSYV